MTLEKPSKQRVNKALQWYIIKTKFSFIGYLVDLSKGRGNFGRSKILSKHKLTLKKKFLVNEKKNMQSFIKCLQKFF